MAFPRIGGVGVPLNLNNAIGSATQLQTMVLSSTGFTQPPGSNSVTLLAGEIFNIPAGTYYVAPGPYTSLQMLDPASTRWITINAENSLRPIVLDSDGGNFRLANSTGCPVGALITTSSAGGYTNGIGTTATGLTITPSAGGSVWVPVVGGQIQLAASAGSVAPITAGSGYLFPPIAVISAPPAGGIQATGHCVMSGGGLTSGTGFVLDNTGAGYTSVPVVTLINNPLDNVGTGAAVTLAINASASGFLTAMYPAAAFGTASGVGGFGLAQTSAITFTFSPAGPAATAIMNFVLTGVTLGASGAGITTGANWMAFTGNEVLSGAVFSAAYNNPQTMSSLTFPRQARFTGAVGTVSGISSAGLVTDAGFGIQQVPIMYVVAAGTFTTVGTLTAAVGGITDHSYVQPF
jgi:hypothetical protein